MGKRKSVWCFTLKADINSSAIPREGIEVQVTHGQIPATIFVGPLKTISPGFDYPRYDGYIWCQKSSTLTEGQAKMVLENEGHIKHVTRLKELSSSQSRKEYHDYCQQPTCGSEDQHAIKRHWDELGRSELPTRRALEKRLSDVHGILYVIKKKPLIDKLMAMPEILNPEAYVAEPSIDMNENVKRLMSVFNVYAGNVRRAIEHNGLSTGHAWVSGLTREQLLNVVICISCLPCFVHRKKAIDNIPGLFYYGESASGKSYLFDKISFYKKVPKDARGVSRFKLDANQRAYLIDDIDPRFLTSNDNQSTIKELALGGSSTVKVRGDTIDCRGWVVITSNAEPDFMTPKAPRNWEGDKWRDNCNAWKRRFISLHFAKACDENPIAAAFETKHVCFVAARKFIEAHESLPHGDLKKSLEPYYDHAIKRYTGGEIAECVKACDSNEYGSSSAVTTGVDAVEASDDNDD